MLGFYNYTVILTYLSTISGILGIYSACAEHPGYGIFFLLVCGLCDMFDGSIARTKKDRTEEECQFGVQIDSLSDFLCFGLLPATIGYGLGLKGELLIFPLIYTLGALIRLAYFNVQENIRRQKENGKARKDYKGLPVTMSTLIFSILYGFKGICGSYFSYIYAGFLILTAFLFLYKKITVPHLHWKGMCVCILIGVLELLWLLYQYCL